MSEYILSLISHEFTCTHTNFPFIKGFISTYLLTIHTMITIIFKSLIYLFLYIITSSLTALFTGGKHRAMSYNDGGGRSVRKSSGRSPKRIRVVKTENGERTTAVSSGTTTSLVYDSISKYDFIIQ